MTFMIGAFLLYGGNECDFTFLPSGKNTSAEFAVFCSVQLVRGWRKWPLSRKLGFALLKILCGEIQANLRFLLL